MARLAKDQLLRCLPCIVTDEEDHISQYGLLLLSELCGATGNVYGTGVRSVWTDVTSIITRLERGEEGEGREAIRRTNITSAVGLIGSL